MNTDTHTERNEYAESYLKPGQPTLTIRSRASDGGSVTELIPECGFRQIGYENQAAAFRAIRDLCEHELQEMGQPLRGDEDDD